MKLQAPRAVALPADALADIPVKVVQLLKRRADTEDASRMRAHPASVRYTLLASFVQVRTMEVTDDAVRMKIERREGGCVVIRACAAMPIVLCLLGAAVVAAVWLEPPRDWTKLGLGALGALVPFTLAAVLDRSRFEFDATQRRLRWRRKNLFRTRSGELALDASNGTMLSDQVTLSAATFVPDNFNPAPTSPGSYVAGSFDIDLCGPLDDDILAIDEDVAVLLHGDAGRAGLDHDLLAGHDAQDLAHVERVILGDGDGSAAADIDALALLDRHIALLLDAPA